MGCAPQTAIRGHGTMPRFELLPLEIVSRLRGRWPEAHGLTADIAIHGIRVPIVLSRHPRTGRLSMRDGNHRVGAAVRLGLETIPAVIVPLFGPDGDHGPGEAARVSVSRDPADSPEKRNERGLSARERAMTRRKGPREIQRPPLLGIRSTPRPA